MKKQTEMIHSFGWQNKSEKKKENTTAHTIIEDERERRHAANRRGVVCYHSTTDHERLFGF